MNIRIPFPPEIPTEAIDETDYRIQLLNHFHIFDKNDIIKLLKQIKNSKNPKKIISKFKLTPIDFAALAMSNEIKKEGHSDYDLSLLLNIKGAESSAIKDKVEKCQDLLSNNLLLKIRAKLGLAEIIASELPDVGIPFLIEQSPIYLADSRTVKYISIIRNDSVTAESNIRSAANLILKDIGLAIKGGDGRAKQKRIYARYVAFFQYHKYLRFIKLVRNNNIKSSNKVFSANLKMLKISDNFKVRLSDNKSSAADLSLDILIDNGLVKDANAFRDATNGISKELNLRPSESVLDYDFLATFLLYFDKALEIFFSCDLISPLKEITIPIDKKTGNFSYNHRKSKFL